MDGASSSSSSSLRNDSKNAKTTGISLLSDDLLHNIISRLPAAAFAAASCVSSPWNQLCNNVLSRPKLASALSLDPSPQVAVREVVEKVLSEPIRPDFAIVSVGSGFRSNAVLTLLSRRLGTKTPIIVSTSKGIIGLDALTDERVEIKWSNLGGDISDDDGSMNAEEEEEHGIVLTVGFVPGLKVDVIPLLRSTKNPGEPLLDKFVTDITNYTMSVSGGKSPVGILLFGMGQEGLVDMNPVMNALDFAMPKETIIVGDEKARFLYKSRDESRNFCGSAKYFTDAVALTFAKAKDNGHGFGDIRFHAALSNGLLSVGPVYKAASVKLVFSDRSTWLTARIEGQRAALDGQEIMNHITDLLDDAYCDIFIGVTKKRNFSIASEKPRSVTSMSFHGVLGGDEEYLYVSGVGIRTGDYFQFYCSDPYAISSSIARVSLHLKNLKSEEQQKNNSFDVFGGLVFSCCGRGNPFFANECLPFTENFDGLPFSEFLCGGEIGRFSQSPNVEEGDTVDIAPSSLHVYSAVYLAMSYSQPRFR